VHGSYQAREEAVRDAAMNGVQRNVVPVGEHVLVQDGTACMSLLLRVCLCVAACLFTHAFVRSELPVLLRGTSAKRLHYRDSIERERVAHELERQRKVAAKLEVSLHRF
jgi:hypothetical protein